LAQLEDDARGARVYEMPSRCLRCKVRKAVPARAVLYPDPSPAHVSLSDMPDDELQIKHETLDATSFGARVAEEEADELGEYFVETDQWKRVYRGDVDVVYGAKGSGKSALYSLLVERGTELFDRNIVILAAEQPRGAPAFKDILEDPPTSEREFIALWKLYLLCLVAELLREYDVRTPEALRVLDYLRDARLIQDERSSLARLVRAVREYARRLRDAEALEGGFAIDPGTGVITGVNGRIVLGEPGAGAAAAKIVSVDSLFNDADKALGDLGFEVWLALDRLDVAFADETELEANALRALFKVYLDLNAYRRISLKIFLRSDIWRRIMDEGFREASHITRHLTIKWNRQALLNLIIRRLLRNESIRAFYEVTDADDVLGAVAKQEALYDKIFPTQVDLGPNKPSSFDWMLSRTRDGTGETAPRELIHLLGSLREAQLRRFELGHERPPDELLFDRAAFKEALPDVSKVRLEQTLFAENANLKPYVELLEEQKTQHTPATLARIWDVSAAEARETAEALYEAGFFERRGHREAPAYWVPFLYRDALNMVQGSADAGLPEDPAD
jgi:hypothetical protein